MTSFVTSFCFRETGAARSSGGSGDGVLDGAEEGTGRGFACARS